MKHLYKLGIDQYTDKYYDINTTSAYLLSVFLKAYRVDPAALGESIGVSKRTAQRYVYNSYTDSLPSLSNIYNCLKHISFPLSEFFSYVELFIKNKSKAAVFNKKENNLVCFSEQQYIDFEKTQDSSILYELISNRHKFINSCGLELIKGGLEHIEEQMNMYTTSLITSTSQLYFSRSNKKENKNV